MKNLVRALVVMFSIFSVAQSVAAPPSPRKTPLEDSAAAVLKRILPATDFARLNWKKTNVAYLGNQPAVLEVADRTDSTTHLIFTYMSTMPVFYWQKITITSIDSMRINGHVVLRDSGNRVLYDYEIKGGFVQGDNLSAADRMMPVYALSTYETYGFTSLYWALNRNPAYLLMFYGVLYPVEEYGPKGKYKPKHNIPGRVEMVDMVRNGMREIEGAFEAEASVTPADSNNLQY